MALDDPGDHGVHSGVDDACVLGFQCRNVRLGAHRRDAVSGNRDRLGEGGRRDSW